MLAGQPFRIESHAVAGPHPSFSRTSRNNGRSCELIVTAAKTTADDKRSSPITKFIFLRSNCDAKSRGSQTKHQMFFWFLLCCVCVVSQTVVLQPGVAVQKTIGLKFTHFQFDMQEKTSAVVRVEKADSSAVWTYFDWNKPATETTWLDSQTSGLLETRIDACTNGTLFVGYQHNRCFINTIKPLHVSSLFLVCGTTIGKRMLL